MSKWLVTSVKQAYLVLKKYSNVYFAPNAVIFTDFIVI